MLSRFVSVFVIGLFMTSPVTAHNNSNLVIAFRDYAFFYEYSQIETATYSYTNYSSNQLPDYLQDAQHGNSRSTEEIATSSAYVVDTALLLNAESGAGLVYDGVDEFNDFITAATDFACPVTNCSETTNADIYRTASGVCNNWNNPHWGEAFTAQERFDHGSWERTALVNYNMTVDGYYFDTLSIGVKAKFDERSFIVKLSGDSAFRLSVFDTSNANRVEESVTCVPSGDDCFGTVPGAIYNVLRSGSCRVDEEVFFTEGSNVFEVIDEANNDCKSRSYVVGYYPYSEKDRYIFHRVNNKSCFTRGSANLLSKYLFNGVTFWAPFYLTSYDKNDPNVVIQPDGSTSDSTLEINGNQADSSSDNKFTSTEITRYWVFVGEDGTFNVSAGTEYSKFEVFLSGNVSTINKLEDVRVAVGKDDSAGGSLVSAEFVLRDTYEVQTYDNVSPAPDYGIVTDLDAVPWIYEYYVLRFGIDINSKRTFSVSMEGDNGEFVTLTINFRNPNLGSFTYSGDATAAVADFSQIARRDFVTVAGVKYGPYDAYWLAWYDNFVYFGIGNQIAKETISTEALELNDVTKFTPVHVSLSSEVLADWVFDIEQVNQPRLNSLATGEPLASALSIAQLLHFEDAATKFSQEVTLAAFQWGQFVDHDFIATPTGSVEGGESPMCCSDGQFVADDQYSEEFCFPIDVVEDVLTSTELAPFNATSTECMNFVRSAIIIDCDGNTVDFRQRHQMNIITSYIDGSNVYGSSVNETESLRESSNAHLHIQTNVYTNNTELPISTAEGEGCAVENVTQEYTVNSITASVTINCNHAGDFRSQEQPMLAGIHTLFVREHNRLVDEFKSLGLYDDATEAEREELFQVVRHIVIAEMQKINYLDFLPSFLSNATIDEYGLGSSCSYKQNTKAAMINLFGIVFRMGHTWIPDDLAGDLSAAAIPHAQTSLPLIHSFFNATEAYTNGSGSVLNNMKKACPLTDRLMEEVPLHFLFGNLDDNLDDTALNLAALNNQRARDHGVPTYKAIRDHFADNSDVVPQSIDDMLELGIVDSTAHGLLKRAYQSIEDIDAFTAAIIEEPLDETTSVGAVINDVLGEMFKTLKRGDRFWYNCYFRNSAVAEIEKVTLGKILCDNVDTFGDEDSQTDLFKLESADNPAISCSARPSMDLIQFRKDRLGGRRSNFGNNLSRRDLDTLAEEEHLHELVEKIKELLDGEDFK